MNFTCPYCGNNAFVVTREAPGAPHATCNICAKVIPFDKNMMTTEPASQPVQTGPPWTH
jgi:transcription elongation factor Elf1